jgi:hypothetical protein
MREAVGVGARQSRREADNRNVTVNIVSICQGATRFSTPLDAALPEIFSFTHFSAAIPWGSLLVHVGCKKLLVQDMS